MWIYIGIAVIILIIVIVLFWIRHHRKSQSIVPIPTPAPPAPEPDIPKKSIFDIPLVDITSSAGFAMVNDQITKIKAMRPIQFDSFIGSFNITFASGESEKVLMGKIVGIDNVLVGLVLPRNMFLIVPKIGTQNKVYVLSRDNQIMTGKTSAIDFKLPIDDRAILSTAQKALEKLSSISGSILSDLQKRATMVGVLKEFPDIDTDEGFEALKKALSVSVAPLTTYSTPRLYVTMKIGSDVQVNDVRLAETSIGSNIFYAEYMETTGSMRDLGYVILNRRQDGSYNIYIIRTGPDGLLIQVDKNSKGIFPVRGPLPDAFRWSILPNNGATKTENATGIAVRQVRSTTASASASASGNQTTASSSAQTVQAVAPAPASKPLALAEKFWSNRYYF